MMIPLTIPSHPRRDCNTLWFASPATRGLDSEIGVKVSEASSHFKCMLKVWNHSAVSRSANYGSLMIVFFRSYRMAWRAHGLASDCSPNMTAFMFYA